jgi:2-polyprenyl-3-methyl-5-hydroxy-6-metoxy-1,4-benzoquinol methylase
MALDKSLPQEPTGSNTQQHSLERIYPNQLNQRDAGNRETLEIHMERYRFASEQLVGQRVLDIACGCGYGTALMAKNHPDKFFVGADVDPEAVAYAKKNYKADNLIYVVGDGMNFSFEDVIQPDGATSAFDTIISLETIEHVLDPGGMVGNLLRQLSSAGIMIGSVPTTPTVDGNPHHLHDFSVRSFHQLFSQYNFSAGKTFLQIQPWKLAGIFSKKESVDNRSQGVARNVLRHYCRRPQALVSRVSSIIINGLNNRYLTAVFKINS